VLHKLNGPAAVAISCSVLNRIWYVSARVLNNIGSARVAAGDHGGIDDMDESIALATRLNIADEIVRAYNNRGTMKILLGRVADGYADVDEATRLAEHYGQRGFVRWINAGPLIGRQWYLGRWDEVVAMADAFIAGLGDEGHYQAASSYIFRGHVRAARGDDAGAAEDAGRAWELARPVGDPQVTGSTLLTVAAIYMAAGDGERATELYEESLDLLRGLAQLGWVVVELHSVAWVAWKLGRGDELLAVVADEPLQSPWLHAGRAVARGDFAAAAEMFQAMGVAALEALYRLRAAEALVAAGRRAEADEQLRPALAFYRGVGAARYVREGEALLAASA
jgi:tetratricopeptide (TPR) repeat protein